MASMRNWLEDLRFERKEEAENVLVIGLGRFGIALATTLMELNIEVMAIDTNADLVNGLADRFTHVAIADGTSAETLKQIGAENFDATVVAIGTQIEASVLATAALYDAGAKTIWAKAMTDEHRRILERVGANHVVQPELEMGQRVAHVVTGQVEDYFQLDENYALEVVEAPAAIIDDALEGSKVRDRFNVTVVGIKPAGHEWTYAEGDTIVSRNDLLLVSGTIENIARFARLASA